MWEGWGGGLSLTLILFTNLQKKLKNGIIKIVYRQNLMVSSFIWNCNMLVVMNRLEILERKLLFGLLDVNNVGIDLVGRGHQPLNNVTWRPDWCGHPRMPWTLPHQSHIEHLLFSITILLCTFRFHFLWQIVFTHGALFGVRSQIIFFLKCKTYWNLTQSPLLWIFKCVWGEVWICIVRLGLKWKHFDDLLFA